MNTEKLQAEMAMKKITVNQMCEKLHISRSAFYRKSHGITEFTQSEIQNIVDFLGIDSPMGIFLMRKCPKRHFRKREKLCLY